MKRFMFTFRARSAESVRFYSACSARRQPREARLRQVDAGRSRINVRHFATRARGGVNHLGFQVESDDELKDLREQFRSRHRCARPGRDVVLLCEVGQVLDRGSARSRLGNVPHARERSIYGEEAERGREKSACCVQTKKTEPARLVQLSMSRG